MTIWFVRRFRVPQISIHTPARGVTASCSQSPESIPISIHTPARGVTNVHDYPFDKVTDFNPHSREGSDPVLLHIPPIDNVNFNPHSREGSDETITFSVDTVIDFNPHSREGSDS